MNPEGPPFKPDFNLDPTGAGVSVGADIAPGSYRHYKGGLYQVIGTVRHCETEAVLVLYLPLKPGPQSLWVRPIEMFTEMLETPDGPKARFAPLSSGESGTSAGKSD